MITITIRYEAPAAAVWSELADLASHSEWMADAGDIEFVDSKTRGLGTQMRVPTRIGPFHTTDLMTVVEWEEGRAVGVEHVGAVSGIGRFLVETSGSGSVLTWSERLRFPWWLGGPIGAWIAQPFLRHIWRGNLRRLGERLVSDP
ncbi:MAG: SRPBCC family protein [Acidimicrobiia bacterium]